MSQYYTLFINSLNHSKRIIHIADEFSTADSLVVIDVVITASTQTGWVMMHFYSTSIASVQLSGGIRF